MTEYKLKSMFNAKINERSDLHTKWEDYAGYTLPYLYPMDETGGTTEFQQDYQSVGAQATNSLSNKIVENMFPQYRPFFRIDLQKEQVAALEENGLTKGQIEEITANTEKEAIKSMADEAYRTASLIMLKNLIVLGNSLTYNPPGQPAQVYSLKDWVVTRDRSGKWNCIIVRDRHIVDTLPPDLKEEAAIQGLTDPEDEVDIFTCIKRHTDGKIYAHQELEDYSKVNRKGGVYTEASNPWLCLTWNLVRGHHYGIGLVEEYAGAFEQLSSYEEALMNLTAIASDIKRLVNPMGHTDIDTLNDSPTGAYVYGVEGDLAYAQMDKLSDYQFIALQRDKVERVISMAFLMESGVTRDAERVTKEEIVRQANELEGSLGGVYSRLAEEWQKPKAKHLMSTLNGPLAGIDVVVLTGLEALSRTSEHDAIMMFFNDLTILQNLPEAAVPYLKQNELMMVLASGRGVDTSKFLKTADEVKKEQQEAMERQAQQEAAIAQAQNAGQQQTTTV